MRDAKGNILQEICPVSDKTFSYKAYSDKVMISIPDRYRGATLRQDRGRAILTTRQFFADVKLKEGV
jgi:hypothetical protein